MENSSYQHQIRQMRILAEAALTHYDIGRGRLSLLAHRSNSTLFQVTSLPGCASMAPSNGDDLRFVLRLCDLLDPGIEQLQSELAWVTAIRRDTDLVVPEPIPARNGMLVISVKVEDIAPVRNCMLFRWVDGRFIDSGLTPAQFERVGTFMARLHQHARQFVPPEEFNRPAWEWLWLFEQGTVFDPAFVASHTDGLIGNHERLLLEKCSACIRSEMQDMPRDFDQYGLIHSDLHQMNYLFLKNEVRAIDFHDCCWGYFLFDIAVTLSGVAGRPDEEKMKQAFIQGYRRICPLPSGHEERLSTFTALHILRRLNYLFHSDNVYIRADIPAYLSYAFRWLEAYSDNRNKHTYAIT